MKSYFWALIAFSFVVFFGLQHEAVKARGVDPRPRPATSDTRSCRLVKVSVEGLTPARIDRAREAFLAVPGVHSVQFKPVGKEAVVDFDITRTNLKSIERSLRAAGFTPYFH